MLQRPVEPSTRQIRYYVRSDRSDVSGDHRVIRDDQDGVHQRRVERSRSSVDSEGTGELGTVLWVGGSEPALRDRRTLHRDHEDPGRDLYV